MEAPVTGGDDRRPPVLLMEATVAGEDEEENRRPPATTAEIVRYQAGTRKRNFSWIIELFLGALLVALEAVRKEVTPETKTKKNRGSGGCSPSRLSRSQAHGRTALTVLLYAIPTIMCMLSFFRYHYAVTGVSPWPKFFFYLHTAYYVIAMVFGAYGMAGQLSDDVTLGAAIVILALILIEYLTKFWYKCCKSKSGSEGGAAEADGGAAETGGIVDQADYTVQTLEPMEAEVEADGGGEEAEGVRAMEGGDENGGVEAEADGGDENGGMEANDVGGDGGGGAAEAEGGGAETEARGTGLPSSVQDFCIENGNIAQAMVGFVKSTLGLFGLDKMIVDTAGDVTITKDGGTILNMLEFSHPVAKVIAQSAGFGDGTTSVVLIAAELLTRASDLVKKSVHPKSIISGYMFAMRKACKYLDEKLAVKVEELDRDSLINCAKTNMSSKMISGDIFASLVVDAVQAVKTTNARGEVSYAIQEIKILKARGKSARESYLLKGYALNTGRAAQGMPLQVAPAKIACLDFNLQKTKMQQGVRISVTDPRELEKIRQREADTTKDRIAMILKAGANVVVTTKGIDDMALKYFVESGAIAVRRVSKEDLRHVANATGATVEKTLVLCTVSVHVSTLADMEGEETFDRSFLGNADEVVEERIAEDDVIMIKGTKNFSAVSVILRGANDCMLDKMDRALQDALCIVKRTLESSTVVAGGGAVEAALSVYLDDLASPVTSREQLAIAEFANSLLVIPKVLAANAAKDATGLVFELKAHHHLRQDEIYMGLDLEKGVVCNSLEAGVIEPAMSKVKVLQFATEAAITILGVDGLIREGEGMSTSYR